MYLCCTIWTPSNAWTLLGVVLGRCLDETLRLGRVLCFYCKAEMGTLFLICTPSGPTPAPWPPSGAPS